MKVMLVCPPFYKAYSAGQYQSESAPLGLGYIASYALSKISDIDLKIADYGIGTYTGRKWQEDLYDFKPDVIGFSTLTLSYKTVMRMAELAKAVGKRPLLVSGGPHASIMPEEVLQQCDIAVRGEGERTFLEILQGKPLPEINGISYRNNSHIISNPDRERIDNLDMLPFPKPSLFEYKTYSEYPTWRLQAARGCPYNCVFCSSVAQWHRITKFRSPGNIVSEIDYLVNDMGVNKVIFQDDTFNVNIKRALDICNLIIEKGLHKKAIFYVQMRANRECVSPALFERMVEANFTEMTFGIETGSDRVMKSINKNLTVAEAGNAVKMAHKAGIKSVKGFFMIGNWGESFSDVVKTWRFIASNPVDTTLTVCTPLPGTDFYNNLKAKGYLDSNVDWSKVDWVTPLSRTDKLPKWAIKWLYYITVICFHLPAHLFRGNRGQAKGLLRVMFNYIFRR